MSLFPTLCYEQPRTSVKRLEWPDCLPLLLPSSANAVLVSS